MLGLIGLDLIGFEIPILRQVIGFIYLTFVPGVIILRLLKVHRLGAAESLLLSTGIGISFIMFSGFFLNTILSFLNIDSPLSFWNVILFITALIAVGSILSFKIDRFNQYELQPLKITRLAFYLMLLPVLSILGTYFVNFHENNILLMFLIVLIALIPVLVALKRIPPELYPLAIVVIALSLLFHRSLISMYLTGGDIHQEYYLHKQILDNAYWNPQGVGNINAMLSIVIIPAVYSYFLKMDGAWVFKIIYPIIFSIVPLGLYCVYKRQITSEKNAFFSVFFFMSFLTFFTEMLSLARQEIAELFFVLIIYLMVQNTLRENSRNVLILIFGISLITSHYGLSYLFIILMIFIYSVSTVLNGIQKIKGFTLPEFNLKLSTRKIFLIFYIVFALLWYMNVSESSAFTKIIKIGDHLITSIFTEFFDPENRDITVLMAIGAAEPLVQSFGREIHRILQFITQIFIIVGFFKIISYREYSKLKAEYFYLIVGCLGLLVLSFLPYSAKTLNMTRIYHIVLLAISPLFIVGGIFVIERLLRIIINKNKLKQDHVILILVLGIMIPYFLFNAGFVYEITKDSPTSMPLSIERMKNYDISKRSFYGTYTPEEDIYSARWFNINKNGTKMTFADGDSKLHVLISYGMIPFDRVRSLDADIYQNTALKKGKIDSSYYLYLNKFDVCDNNPIIDNSISGSLSGNSSKVYSNGCGEIYAK